VPQDKLGLFDTPPTTKQIRFSVVVVCVLFAILPITMAMRDFRLGQYGVFIPMIDAVTLLADLIIATLLYVQASVYRSRALTVLGSSYVFTGLILIPHVLTFPGAFAPDGLLGARVSTTAWLYVFWRTAIPLAVILYVLIDHMDSSPTHRRGSQGSNIVVGAASATALVVAATILATSGHDLLPVLFINRSTANFRILLEITILLFALFIIAMGLLFWHRRSLLDLWLLVVLSAWLVQTMILSAMGGRFTAGWYSAVVIVLLSHLFLMLALIAESSWLYSRLALATAARNREREVRLMTISAVAAAIAHEVGQPLAAFVLNAKSSLDLLNQSPPNIEKATTSLHVALDAGQVTFDVLKSSRAIVEGGGAEAEFDINALVRETASMLDRELVGAKVLLQLALDDAVPPILGNRVQVQRVLVNLFTNAIESLGTSSRRHRRIAIRSGLRNSREVLLEVSDTGSGIAPEKLEHIFDAFFTTKKTGTGLGLALSRIIIEEHGGKLWASSDDSGATFYLQLPFRRLSI
jgi:signal transduction histidine kinase